MMFSIFRRNEQNVLEMIPMLKEEFSLEPEDDQAELLQLRIPRTSWLEKLSIRYLKQPTHIKVRLDPLGSFVLSQCNGQHTVEQIAEKLEQTFGDQARPTLPRLLKFLEIVEANGWITYKSNAE